MNQFVHSHQSEWKSFVQFSVIQREFVKHAVMINTKYNQSVKSAYDKYRSSKGGCRTASQKGKKNKPCRWLICSVRASICMHCCFHHDDDHLTTCRGDFLL